MTISDNYAPDVSPGNGSTTVFTGDWSPLVSTNMRVALELISTGVQTLQTLGTDYTLTFTSSGYSVTMATAPSSLYNVVRYREVAINQTSPYSTSQGFQGLTIEQSFDKLTAIAQDTRDIADRGLKLTVGSTVSPLLPIPEPNKILAWNGAATALTNIALQDNNVGNTNIVGTLTVSGVTALNSLVYIDQRVIRGHTASISTDNVTPDVQNHTTSASSNGFGGFTWINNSGGTQFSFAKSRGGVGTYTIVQDGDDIGVQRYNGADGTDFREGFREVVEVDGTPGNDDVPMRKVWLTQASGGSLTEKMRFTSDGNLGIGGTPNANAIAHVTSTTKQAIPAPVMTTAQKNALTGVEGGLVFDSDLNAHCSYSGSAWGTLTPSSRFTSTDQTITAGGTLTLAHGLGAVPFTTDFYLVCQTGEHNYTAGDIVKANLGQSTASVDSCGVAVIVDATNIVLRFGSEASTFKGLDKTAGTGVDFTNANWLLRVKAMT